MGRRRTPQQQFSNFEISKNINQNTYNDYLTRMADIYLNLYHYKNMPISIDKRFFVQQMMYRPGIAIFREDEINEIFALPFNVMNIPDIYGNPTQIMVYSANGYTRTLNKGQFAIVWSNFMRYTPWVTIELFARRITEIQRTIDVNVHNQKTPKLVKTTQNGQLTTKNILKDIDGYVPVITVDEGYKTENLESIDINSPYICDKLDVHKNLVWNEFLTWCGIENSNMDKKERLVANEVMGNYGNVEMGRNTGLSAREYGLEIANEMFGTDIQVSFNSNIPTMLNSPELLNIEGRGTQRQNTRSLYSNYYNPESEDI